MVGFTTVPGCCRRPGCNHSRLSLHTILYSFPLYGTNPLPGDRIIVNRLAYRLGDPQRGDVVVFHYPLDPSRDYIKRVVAVGGDTVEARNNVLYVNGQPQPPEKYLPPGVVYSDFGPVKVPPNNYFMMGDNRNNSADSRVWGTLDRRLVIGKAMFIFWPLNRLGLIR